MNALLCWLLNCKNYYAEKRYKEKINYLYKYAYQYFYDIQETRSYVTSSDSIEFLPYITESYRRKRAEENATNEIIRLITDAEIEKVYRQING